MPFPALKEASERYGAIAAQLKSVFDEAGPEYDMSKVTSLQGSTEDKLDWIRAKNAELEDSKIQLENLRMTEKAAKATDDALAELGDGASDDPGPGSARPKLSLGAAFIRSMAYTGRDRSGNGPEATLDIDIRNTLFETTAGWAPESVRTGIVSYAALRPAVNVVNYIPSIPTGQAAVPFMRETTATNAAAGTAEGGAYAESALALTQVTQTVEKIATFIPVTDEQLEDEQMAAAYLDMRLGYFVRQNLDGQVLTGSGTSPALEGTENVTGIQTQALGADTTEDAIYKLFTSIRSSGFAEPTVAFINPTKWQTVRLRKTADGIYIWGNPSQPGPDTVWGVPVVQTTAHTSTKVVAGDYAVHSFLAMRSGVSVKVSDSHSDFFVKGKLAVRADLRAAMVHLRPAAFGVVTGL